MTNRTSSITSENVTKYSSAVFWDEAERPLLDIAEAKVLAIFSCPLTCAPISQKGPIQDHRTYQMLTADSKLEATSRSVKELFTSAFLEALKNLPPGKNENTFPTTRLLESMSMCFGHSAKLWDRLQGCMPYEQLFIEAEEIESAKEELELPKHQQVSPSGFVVSTHYDTNKYLPNTSDVTKQGMESLPTILEGNTTEATSESKSMGTRQHVFESAIERALGIPAGYQKVQMLLVRWDDDLDDFKGGHARESERLRDLFESRLGYSFTETKLAISRGNPHDQLNIAIRNLIEENDGPDNLLIVYYTGHAVKEVDNDRLKLVPYVVPDIVTKV